MHDTEDWWTCFESFLVIGLLTYERIMHVHIFFNYQYASF